MHIRRRRGWELPEAQATPEAVFLNRRRLLAGSAAGLLLPRLAAAQGAPRNPRFEAGRALTAERDATTYNNFYEFGTDKSIHRAAQRLPISPWQIKLDGMVERTRTLDLDELLKQVQLEERVYRHRCVEAWAMTVPWTGFPLAELVRIAEPKAGAKYVEFETLADPKTMPGL